MIAIVFLIVFLFLLAVAVALEVKKLWLIATKLKNYSVQYGLPLFGSGARFLGKSNEEIMKIVHQIFYETTKRPVVMWLGPMMTFCVDDPEEMQTFLNAEQFLEKPYIYQHLHNNTGLLGAPIDIWKQHRKHLNPTFNPKILQSYFPTFNAKARTLVDQMKAKVGQNIDLTRPIFKCLMDLILNTGLGMEWEMQSSRGDQLYDMFVQCMYFFQRRIVRFWLRYDFVYNLTPTGRKEHEVLTRGYQFLRSIREIKALEIAEKLDKGEDQLEESKQKNMLTWIQKCFMLFREGKFTEQHLIEEIDTLFVGGTDTTSGTIVSILVMLAVHQECQDKVFEELRDVFETADSPVNYEDLPKLPYLEMVIKETMRHLPVAPLFARKCVKDFPYKGGIIPKGSMMLMNISKLHRDERFWGPSANEFWPERFLPENFDNIHPFAYLPFSGGPRNCVGIKYAWCVTKLVLIYLLRRFKFTTKIRPEEIQTKICIMMKISNKDPVCLQPREW